MPRIHRSAYFDICCAIWDTARPCTATEVAMMLADIPNWMEVVNDLIEMGKLARSDDGSISNAKAIAEAMRAFEIWQRKSEGGTKGGLNSVKSRANKDERRKTPADTGEGTAARSASGTVPTELEPELEPENDKSFGAGEPAEAYPPSFEEFWSAYPLKKAKLAAVKAWKAALKRLGGGVKAQDRLKAAATALDKTTKGRDREFIPHPATWLNAGGYDDDPIVAHLAKIGIAPIEPPIDPKRLEHEMIPH